MEGGCMRFFRLDAHSGAVQLALSLCALTVPFEFLSAQPQVAPLETTGDYLIEATAAATSAKLAAADAVSIRKVGQFGTLLIKPVRTFGSTSGSGSSIERPGNIGTNDPFCASLVKRGLAKSCSPNYRVRASLTSNDPSQSQVWGLGAVQGINAPAAWDLSTGSEQIVVAIIDTGIDTSHPDLAANLWRNSGEIPANGIDDDRNGYIDDLHGINAVVDNGNPMDDNGHGTHVAGTIGAVGNNGVGVAGVNWQVRLMGLKFLDRDGAGSLAGAIDAIDYMVAMKNRGVNIRVSNNSWGGGGYSGPLFSAIERANNAGIVFAAAAGNESNDNDASPSYPASYDVPNVVSVAAVDAERNLANFSNFGATSVDIAAPGVQILSTYPGNRYVKLSGTSMATPHVSGALALLAAHDASLDSAGLIDRLYGSGVELQTLGGAVRTGRYLNVARMLSGQTTPLPVAPPSSGCQYQVEAIPFAPDNIADAGQIVIQSDENAFYKAILPFSFPFHGQGTQELYLSPNGVAYTRGAPSSMDYQNQSIAPANSIAALHTDLLPGSADEGVRIAALPDRATVNWRMHHYSMQSGGAVRVWLTLHSNGVIEQFMHTDDSAVQSVLQSGATVGLTGARADTAFTFATNSSLISSGMGVRFTPVCTSEVGASAEVHSIKVKKSKSEAAKSSGASSRYSLALAGSGSGTVLMSVSLNSQLCPEGKAVNLTNGSASLQGRAPRLPASVRTLRFTAGDARGALRLSSNSAARGARLSAKSLAKQCSAVISRLQQ